MENKLEELLNILIERGWCPFGKRDVFIETGEGYDFGEGFIILKRKKGGTYTCESKYMPYRMLCTKSSGLWQFVCENDYWVHKDTYFVEKYTDHTTIHLYQCNDYRYWLLGSSLKDESELEDFLLNSISLHE